MADEIESGQFTSPNFNSSNTDTPKTRHLQSDIIEVLVGPNEARYNVHEGFICNASSFFAKCLQTNMAEAASKVVRLPEDDPEVFERVLGWVYFAEIDHNLVWHLDGMRELVKIYALADKLCMEKLANLIMDISKEWHRIHCSYATLLIGAPLGLMKEHLTEQLAWDIRRGMVWKIREKADDLAMFLCSGAPEIHDVMEAIKTLGLIDPRGNDFEEAVQDWDCKYHKHIDTGECIEEPPAWDDWSCQ